MIFRPIRFLSCIFFVVIHFSSYGQVPSGYYDSALDLSGHSLKQGLNEIVNDHQTFSYTSTATDVWDILKESDQDPDSADNVLLVYTGRSVNAAQEYNSRLGWSREHVWAKSHGDFGTGRGAGTDLHHLKPADISVNSARNNKDFESGGDRYFDDAGTVSTDCFSDTYTWEPRDEVKGDIARMIFYMAVRYIGEEGDPQLSILDQVNTIEWCDDENKVGYMGRISTLLVWHAQDPVDSFEYRRNEVIYSYQHNRNPFIDHPEFAQAIWDAPTSLDEEQELPFPDVMARYHELTIFPQGEEIQKVLVYASNGVLAASAHHVMDNMTIAVPPGIYFLVVERSHRRTTQKIMVQ